MRGYIIYLRAINHIMIFLNYYKLIAYCLNMDYHNGIIPSLTVEEQKNGCKASKIKACSRFLFRSDMCFCAIFFAYGKFISFVCLMMLRIVDFLINS